MNLWFCLALQLKEKFSGDGSTKKEQRDGDRALGSARFRGSSETQEGSAKLMKKQREGRHKCTVLDEGYCVNNSSEARNARMCPRRTQSSA